MRAKDLYGSLDALAELLTKIGIPADVDPTKVQVPGAWVTLAEMTPATLDGEFTTQAAIYLVARDNGTPEALTSLANMLEEVAGIWPALSRITPDSLTLPGDITAQLPALRIETDLGV